MIFLSRMCFMCIVIALLKEPRRALNNHFRNSNQVFNWNNCKRKGFVGWQYWP